MMAEFIGSIEEFETLRLKLIAGLSKCKEAKSKGSKFDRYYYFEEDYLKDLAKFIGIAGDLRNMFDKPFDCALCQHRKVEAGSDEYEKFCGIPCVLNMAEHPEAKNMFTPIGIK
jgi:hypothetical protein